MRAFDKIARNAVLLTASRFIQKILSFVLLWFLVQYLSPENFGIYSFVVVWITTAAVFTDMGTSQGAVKFWAESPSRMARTISFVFKFKLLFAVLGIVVSVFLWFAFYDNLPVYALFFICAGILLQFHSAAWSPFQAELNNLPPLVWATLNRLLVVAAIAISLLIMPSAFAVLCIEVFVPILLIAKLMKECYKLSDLRKTDEPPFEYKRLISEFFPLGLMAILSILYFRVDVFMIMKMMTEKNVGQYAAGFRLIEPLLTLPGVLGSTLFPVIMNRIAGDDKIGAMRSVERSARIMPLTMTFIALPLSFLSTEIIDLLFGAKYSESANVMALLAWTLPLAGWGYSWSGMILADRKYAYSNFLAGSALFTNVLTNLWAIPKFGIAGAALTTLGTEMIISFGTSLPILKYSVSGIKIFMKHLIIIIGSILIAMSGNEFGNIFSKLIFIGVSLLFMTGTSFLFTLITKDDINGIENFIRSYLKKNAK